MNELTGLISLLGNDNVETIKKELTDMIIDNLRESVDKNYLLTPDDILDDVEKIIIQAQKELIKERKDEIKGIIKEKLNDEVDKIIEKLYQ